jgi:transcriptional regulator with XRE-family HTH domain
MENKTDFPTWLLLEMQKRNWNQSDLSRKSGVSSGQISRLLSGNRNPTHESLISFAKAFNLPEENVFRAAGFIKKQSSQNNLTAELNHLFEQLPPQDQEEILEIARYKISRREKHEKHTSTRRVGSGDTAPDLR